MFDPTIFDNLKVVLEGNLYDQDAEGIIVVTRREDLLDLAGMGRSFSMEIRLPKSLMHAVIRLTAGLPDFAAELRGIRLAGEQPGAVLEIMYHLPGEPFAARIETVLGILDKQWGSEAADLSYEEIIRYRADSAALKSLKCIIRFRQKMDESQIGDLESLVEHLIASLELLEDMLQ